MMEQKALLFKDIETAEKVLMADNPGKAKALGRCINNFDQELWDNRKTDIVVQGNIQQFSQNLELHEFLVNTGQRVLVEASPVDKIWGAGLAINDPLINDPKNWKGLNLLGFSLMEVRKQLRAAKTP